SVEFIHTRNVGDTMKIHERISTRPETVGILIGNYRKGEFLNKTLETIQAQIYKDFKVYVFDSSNLESERKILEGWKDRLPLAIFYDDRRRELAYAYNYLLSYLSHRQFQPKYVIFFSSDDDFGNPRRLLEQVRMLERNPDVDFVYTDIEVYLDDIFMRLDSDNTSIITCMFKWESIKNKSFSGMCMEDDGFLKDVCSDLRKMKCQSLGIKWLVHSENSKMLTLKRFREFYRH
ncbi:MAG: glycosyltransferase family A protein, partial [Candidatus Thorarchaeota archaeon]